MALDIIDEKLLEVLQDNARISISEISKKINLSLSAVSERLKKLEASGVIEEYTTIINAKSMNKSIVAVAMVSVDAPNNAKEFLNIVKNCDDILMCSRITGEHDYMLKIVTDSQETLASILDAIKNDKATQHVQTYIDLGDIKMKYSVSPVATKL